MQAARRAQAMCWIDLFPMSEQISNSVRIVASGNFCALSRHKLREALVPLLANLCQ
jgi:hypothetical protein